jgi:histidine ammonia-lyase
VHALVRSRVPTLDEDRAPAPDIAMITELIASSELENSCASRVK